MEKIGGSRSATATACLVFLLLVFASREAITVEGKRTCESQSHRFKGRCLSDHNCGLVCRNEGFSNGWCRGLRQRCFCTKPWKSQVSVASMAKMISGLVLLLHLLISQNEVMHVEAAVCEVPSKLFHGVCFLDSNCARICEKEGYLSGNCKGVLLRCICFKDCGGGSPVNPPEGPPDSPPEGPPDSPPTGTPDSPPNPPGTPYPQPPITPCPSPQPPVPPCPCPPCGCPKPPGGCPNPPIIPIPNPPTDCPNPPINPIPSPPTGCPNPPIIPFPSPPTGCPNPPGIPGPNPPSGCPKPPGKS